MLEHWVFEKQNVIFSIVKDTYCGRHLQFDYSGDIMVTMGDENAL